LFCLAVSLPSRPLFTEGDAHLEPSLEDLEQLLGLRVARVLDLEVAALGHDLLRGERPLCVPPSRVGPPPLDLLHLLGKDLVFPRRVDGGVVHVVGSHAGQELPVCELVLYVQASGSYT
jgi:hypothetical protein